MILSFHLTKLRVLYAWIARTVQDYFTPFTTICAMDSSDYDAFTKVQGVAQRGIQEQPVESSRTAAGFPSSWWPIQEIYGNMRTRVGKILNREKRSGAGQPKRTACDDLIMETWSSLIQHIIRGRHSLGRNSTSQRQPR
ncbi:hypothetical protein PoB_006750900 [Plakobranchus ocellatus]|uniref:Uncharacterized protein n=1 Tax=Plakobranchus ocellatus TaxID=259542 RepID=A0AAV4D9V5_9GAST|nr:hypothetical protein PoB_006750900 [Plakobranchus ocellatus]